MSLLAIAALLAAQDVTDPSKGEVPLATLDDGWAGRLVFDAGEVGVWCVRAHDVFPQYACPELVATDDEGRCHVLVSYSGKWTPLTRVGDADWLGTSAHADVDPRREGAELYVGGAGGNLYQLDAYPHGALDARLVAHLPGRELHTLVAGDLDPRTPGAEVLVFTRPGGLFSVTPTGEHGGFVTTHLAELPGRVRDALVLPGSARTLATVSRAGQLALLTLTEGEPRWEVVFESPMGMGRLAAAPDGSALYTTLDDGRVLRHARGDGGWTVETIYRGPQGPRGLAAGRFSDDDAEQVAVFGYSGVVQLLTRGPDGWSVRDLFEDRDRGHWLEAVEVDGRNGTHELVGSGYGGRVFLLSRPPGYGVR